MNDIQNKISDTKTKLEDKKSISNYNKIIKEAQRKRNETLLEIGKIAYKKFKINEIEDEEMIKKYKAIAGFDYIIYENKKLIQEINKRNQGYICSCGTEIPKDSKFCIGCGSKVEIPQENIEYIQCFNCEMNIPSEAKFCPCCGYEI